MRVLLASGGFRTSERVALLGERMRAAFGAVERVLFVPYALGDHDRYLEMLSLRGLDGGYALDGLHKAEDPVAAVKAAAAIYVGGGNTFRLVDALHRLELLEPIRERVEAGVPYLGVSAGTNVACPTMQTTNDMPICRPPSFAALGLVPFQVNTHYYSGQAFVQQDGGYVEHFGETRDERLAEYHQLNDRPVVGLWEGGIIEVEGEALALVGAPARVFRRGLDPVDVAPGGDLAAALSDESD